MQDVTLRIILRTIFGVAPGTTFDHIIRVTKEAVEIASNPLLLFQERLYRALAPRLNGTLVINLLPRTALELTHALTLIEQWIGQATPYPVAGLINVIVHVIPRDQASSDL